MARRAGDGRLALRVLVIEDNDVERRSITRMLDELGCEPAEAPDARAAKQHLSQEAPIDVVLTDMFMAQSDGLEAAHAVRAARPDTPMIAMSSGDSDAISESVDYVEIAKAFGSIETLRKPFGIERLEEALSRVMARAGD